jgi:CheY-like chemotaxis protein
VLALLESLLVDAGYSVRAFGDPIAALGAFSAEPERVDLVVADVVMPSLSGGELLARMRALYPSVRALLLSGYHDPLGEVDPLDGVLRKPIEAHALIERVSELLEGSAPAIAR